MADLRGQLLATRGTKAAPIVRVASADANAVKFIMDSGAAEPGDGAIDDSDAGAA